MPTIGQQLQQAREAKSITIEQAASETKINQQFLCALEADNYEEFNEEFYIKQYIRTYAYYLGLNARILIDHVDENDYEEKGEIHVSQLLFEQKKRATERTQRQYKVIDVLQRFFMVFIILVVLISLWVISTTLMPKREFHRQGELGIVNNER